MTKYETTIKYLRACTAMVTAAADAIEELLALLTGGKYGDICDKCVHGEYCAMATFGGHNPKITACWKYAERQKLDERSEDNG